MRSMSTKPKSSYEILKQAALCAAEDLMQRLTCIEARIRQCNDAVAALEAVKAGRDVAERESPG